jgi:AsmA protein
MKKIIKKSIEIFTTIIGIIAFLAIIGMFVLVKVVNLNEFKPQISDYVYKHTGYQLAINGPLSWTFFPYFGVRINDVTLSNKDDFTPTDFIKIGEANVEVSLIDLLLKKINIEEITLKNSTFYLQRDKSGKTNFHDLVVFITSPKNNSKVVAVDNTTTGYKFSDLSGLDIKNANVYWQDAKHNRSASIKNFNLDVTDVQFDQPVKVISSFILESSSPAFRSHITIDCTAEGDSSSDIYKLKNLQVISTQDKPYTIKSELIARGSVNFADNTFVLDKFALNIADLSIDGNVHGSALDQEPELNGHFLVHSFSPKRLFSNFEKELKTGNENILHTAGLSGNFTYTDGVLNLKEMQIYVDEMNLQGGCDINFYKQDVFFNLGLSQLNLNRYKDVDVVAKLRLQATPGQAISPRSNQGVARNKPQSSVSQQDGQYKNWRFAGDLKIGNIIIKKLIFNNATVHLIYANKIFLLEPFRANFYQGIINGKSKITKLNGNSLIAVQENLTNVHLAPLLSDLIGKAYVRGNGDLALNFTSDTQDFFQKLNGNGNLKITKGTIKGVNIDFVIATAYSLLRHTILPSQPQDQTSVFNQATASFNIKNGVVSNRDLLISGQNYRVTGRGIVNLSKETIDYKMRASKVKYSVNKQPYSEAVFVPIDITGTFADLNYNVDFKFVLQNFVLHQATQIGHDIIQTVKTSGKIGVGVGQVLGKIIGL